MPRACVDPVPVAPCCASAPRGRRRSGVVGAVVGAVVSAALPCIVVALQFSGCAHPGAPSATAGGCARARLAREWQGASTRPFVGCWQGAPLPGVVALTERPADVGDYADEPPTFALVGDPVVERPTQQTWELLGHGLARLTWSTGFGGVTACLAARDGDHLVGELRTLTHASPLPSAPVPVALARVPCPAR
ncbi:MAG: hypothetical protein FJ137_14685 [Deltaproteobacteria bacterium]|nr:hypothetical protein [Deltaproteobacteria bacterium]